MKTLNFNLVLVFVCAGLSTSAFAENWTCLSDVDSIEAFESKDMERAPNYTVAPFGGARVQKQHPETYMFAQAKYFKEDDAGAAVCQYSNHVGLVATYLITNVRPVDSLKGCEQASCKAKPHWREEWVESKPEGPRGEDTMFVCVQTIGGLDRPSSDCEFTGYVK